MGESGRARVPERFTNLTNAAEELIVEYLEDTTLKGAAFGAIDGEVEVAWVEFIGDGGDASNGVLQDAFGFLRYSLSGWFAWVQR